VRDQAHDDPPAADPRSFGHQAGERGVQIIAPESAGAERVLLSGPPLSCIPAVVMQKVSQRPNLTENADNADEAEIVQRAYFL